MSAAATPSSSAEMSVTYDDSVGVEVSSDSFWEVMQADPSKARRSEVAGIQCTVVVLVHQEERNVAQSRLGTCSQMACGRE